MQRLKHPVRSIREPFGKAGLTVAILALVLAVVGGAYAAGGLTKSQEKQVTKIAKKFAGKPGANGTNGAPGSPGAKGDKGDPGTSVTSASFEEEAGPCTEGGSEFKAANGTTYACNGKNGKSGFTETLPSTKTEKGEWALTTDAGSETPVTASDAVSFNIPLASAPTPHYIRTTHKEPFWNPTGGSGGTGAEEERTQPACPGNAAEPKALSSNLCVYASAEDETEKNLAVFGAPEHILPIVCSLAAPPEVFGSHLLGCMFSSPTSDKTGFGLVTVSKATSPPNQVFVVGTWAVTG